MENSWLRTQAARFSSARFDYVRVFLSKNYRTIFNVLLGIVWGIIREVFIYHTQWLDCLMLRGVGLFFDLIFTQWYFFFWRKITNWLGVKESKHYLGPQFWSDSTLFMIFWTGVYMLNIGLSYALGLDVLKDTPFLVAIAWFAPAAFAAGRPFTWVLEKIVLLLKRFGLFQVVSEEDDVKKDMPASS